MGIEGPERSSNIHPLAHETVAPGDEAAVLLRAQELGCLPEAALALVALTDFRLVGSAADGGLFQIETTWPAAWRLHATRCHRALAEGCQDDVDLLLQVFAEWQVAPDPDAWCATWWINPATMSLIQADVAAVFADLASAGPIGMRHPVDPSRAPRVRDALAAGYSGQEYVRVGSNEYRPAANSGTGPSFRLSPLVLTSGGEQLLALSVDRERMTIEHVAGASESTPQRDNQLATVRSHWPVGSIVEIETLGSVAAGRIILDILTIHRGFPYPATPVPVPTAGDESLPELVAAATHPSNPIDRAARVRARVTGYRALEDGKAVLVVDPLAQGAPIDPAEHPDLGTWDDIEVEVKGVTSDHLGPLLELGRTDGQGGFAIAPAAGLSASDVDFGRRLAPGAVLTARVLPEAPVGDHVTVSLLPVALRHLEAAPGIGDRRPVDARIVGRNGDTWTLELAHHDTTTGMSHRFNIPRNRFAPTLQPAPGMDVSVVLRPDRSSVRRRIVANRGLIEFAASNPDTFAVEDGWLQLAAKPPHIPAVLELLSYSSAPEWEREVIWMYEDNLHLEVALAGPPGDEAITAAADKGPGFLLPTPARVAEPVEDQEDEVIEDDLAPRPTIVAMLPEDGLARIHGPEGRTLAELRRSPGIISIDLEGQQITVVGDTGRAVRSLVAEMQSLILPAKGKLIVPPGQGKRLIGIDGTTLRALEARTGAKAFEPEDGELWTIEGPSSQAVKTFIRLAAEQVPGIAGRVTGIEDLEIVQDRTMPGQGIVARRSGAPQPPAHQESTDNVASAVTEAETATEKPQIESDEGAEARPQTVRDMQAAMIKARKGRRSAQRDRRRERKARRDRKERSKATEHATPTNRERSVRDIKPRSKTFGVRAGLAMGTLSRATSLLLKTVALLLVAGAVIFAIVYVAPRFASDDASTAAAATVIDTTVVTTSPITLASLDDASALAPSSCWLAVLGTWDGTAEAEDSLARLGESGLTATTMASDVVPGWASDRVVTVVATETPTQAAEVVARTAAAGFRGVAVESTVEACAGAAVTPAGASLGFMDVPVSDPAYAAVLWMANTGLAEACNPPVGDEFCPNDTVTGSELDEILTSALATPPAEIAAGPATHATLYAALDLPDGAATPDAELTRADLAVTLFAATGSAGN